MALLVKGRYGYFTPKGEAAIHHRKKQQRLERQRRADAAARETFKARHRLCLNGCGHPPAWYDGPHLSLRFSGCCSAACQQQYLGRP